MKNSLYPKTFMLYVLIIFIINISPVTMQTITVEIENLESLVSSSLDRLLGVIDPTIDTFQNATIEILAALEERIKINISETLYWLETNLFVLLFVIIVFFIFIFLLLNLLDVLLVRYGYLAEERRFVGLTVITVIFVWLFTAMILSTWPPTNKFDLQTLKYVLVGLLCLMVLYLIIVWICYLYTHRTDILDLLKQLCGCGRTSRIVVQKTPINPQEYIDLSTIQL